MSVESPKKLSLFRDYPKIVESDFNEDYGLKMLCYDHGLNLDEEDLVTQECRGIVFSKDGEIVSKAFGYTPIFVKDNFDETLKEFVSHNFKDCKFYHSYEGALVRAFFYQDKWFLSTHRKLDAYKSSWGTTLSFGELFARGLKTIPGVIDQFTSSGKELVNDFLDTLDKDKQYVFLIKSTIENRIVSMPPNENSPGVIYVGTFKDCKLVENTEILIPSQTALSLTSLNEAFDIANSFEPSEYQGLILFAPNNRQYKIYSDAYNELFNLRDNVSSVMFRYLQIRTEENKLNKFRNLYPEWKTKFDKYEEVIRQLASRIYDNYVRKFIKKEDFVISKLQYKVVKSIHTGYLNSRSTNRYLRVDEEYAFYHLNKCEASHLNHLIREYLKPPKREIES